MQSDVVIVGGGIAGAALGFGLASAGVGVTILESTTTFRDRVRGESMHAWGVLEARNLGIEDTLLGAGAQVVPIWRQYRSGSAAARETPMHAMIPGIPGTLNLHHPVACQALLNAAEGAGASVRRGTQNVEVTLGTRPTVKWTTDGAEASCAAGLVVGADGRASTVRRSAGLTLERQEPISWISGLLLEGLEGVPADFDLVEAGNGFFFILTHQGGGRARAYYCPGAEHHQQFSGPAATEAFLAACGTCTNPWAAEISSATPVGPCATYPGDDTWIDRPYASGTVLIGDAAGHNDPIMGQGLSVALRDARLVRDAILAGTPPDFEEYADERAKRMERLRLAADIIAVTTTEDCENRPARYAAFDHELTLDRSPMAAVIAGGFIGPENVPDEAVDWDILRRIRGGR